jgi:flagellar basal-body rod protein FlgB
MMGSMFDGTTIPLLEKINLFADRRHDALTANIANIDTPNYHRRDLPVEAFEKALREAVASGKTRIEQGEGLLSGGVATRSLGGASGSAFPDQLFQAAEAQSPSLTFQDNNNRSIEHEIMEMTKNSLMQSFAITLMNTQFGMLQAAIREQV